MNEAIFNDILAWMDGEMFDDATPQDVKEKAAWFASGEDRFFILCYWDLCNNGYTVHSCNDDKLAELLQEKMEAPYDEGFSMLVLRRRTLYEVEDVTDRLKLKISVEIV